MAANMVYDLFTLQDRWKGVVGVGECLVWSYECEHQMH